MSDASDDARPGPEGTPRAHPVEGDEPSCPVWCWSHESFDEGQADEYVVHCGSLHRAGSTEVQLRQVQFVNSGDLDAVVVRVDDDLIAPRDVMDLAVAMLLTVSEQTAEV